MRIPLHAYALGMPRDGQVTLAPHHPKWEEAFEVLSLDLEEFVQPLDLTLHHIGSTSIPDIRAKPILDILGTVGSLEELDKYRQRFEDYGLVWKGEYGIAGRRYCTLYDAEEKNGYLHLHMFEKDSPEAARHLLFRDYLRAHPAVAARYDAEKERLLREHAKDRKLYTPGKTDFIQQALRDAQRWKEAT